jgi:hypothetical protein
MKNFNDTTATIYTAISGSSAIIAITAIQPIITFIVGLLGIVSGVLACVYYIKKLRR